MTAYLPDPTGQTPPSEPVPELIAPEAAQAAATSMTQLVRSIMQNRMAGVSRDGPTLDDLMRVQIRLQLKEWLDIHLPPLVERELQVELERLSASVPF